MSVDSLKDALPEHAKDLKLNLGSIVRSTVLSEQRLWGTLLAAASATRSQKLLKEISEDALDVLSAEAAEAALGAAAIMGMNNVFYRARHFLGGKYDDLRAGLRMNIIANPGVPKADFELWALAVSTINGCEACVASHEAAVREEGVSREEVLEAIKAAAILAGVGQALTTAEAL